MPRVGTIFLVALGTLPSSSALAHHAAAAARSDGFCRAAMARAIARQTPADVPTQCWRVGPIELGMRNDEVEERLGPPVAVYKNLATDLGPRRLYTATLYKFTAKPGPLVRNGHARVRLAELLYYQGRLAAIDNAPGAQIDGYECQDRTRRAASNEVVLSARSGPLLTLAGVAVGERLISLRRHFGHLPAGNGSHDWYSYLPVPISFEVDPDRAVITGFDIATDEQALMTSARPKLHLYRDPRTCRLLSIQFELGRN